MQEKQNKQEPGFQGISIAAANAILNLYRQLSIPTMDHRNIVRKLSIYHEKIVTIRNIVKRAGASSEVKERVENVEPMPNRCLKFVLIDALILLQIYFN